MSKNLLRRLAGNSHGAFKEFIDSFDDEPRIAWYPSAGMDLRDLLYLHQNFSLKFPANRPELELPQLFIHTDYFPWNHSGFLDSKVIYSDDRTEMVVQTIEELPRVDLPLDPKIVEFPDGNAETGRVIFLKIKVTSNVLGEYTLPLVYIFAENAAFCEHMALPENAKFSYIIHVRYGGGFGGGGKSTGSWLVPILLKLGCKIFVTDGSHSDQEADLYIKNNFQNIRHSKKYRCTLEPIRVISSRLWSDYGNVSWNLVNAIEKNTADQKLIISNIPYYVAGWKKYDGLEGNSHFTVY